MIVIIFLIIVIIIIAFLYCALVGYTRNVEEDDFEFDEENFKEYDEEESSTKGQA